MADAMPEQDMAAVARPAFEQPVAEAAAPRRPAQIPAEPVRDSHPAHPGAGRPAATAILAGQPTPIGFATIPYPIEDEPESERRKTRGFAASGDGDENDGETGDGAEDGDKPARRQASEWDEIGEEPEDLPPLSRSASDADLAYRQYQRMRGF